MTQIDPVNLCLSTSECFIELGSNFNAPKWCFEVGIEISGEGKGKTVLPLGRLLTCRPLFIKASWEHGYILLGGLCVLWSSLQPAWVPVCNLLCSYISAAGDVVQKRYCYSAEWVSSLYSGPWAFGGSHSCWGSSNSPAEIPALGPSSSGELVSPLLSAEEKADGGTRRVVGWGGR